MKYDERNEYPLVKEGHTTSTVLVCMFIGFAIGFLACHQMYTTRNVDVWKKEVRKEFYYEEIQK